MIDLNHTNQCFKLYSVMSQILGYRVAKMIKSNKINFKMANIILSLTFSGGLSLAAPFTDHLLKKIKIAFFQVLFCTTFMESAIHLHFPILFPDRHSTNPVFFPSLLPYSLLPILLFQKPVLIAVRFIGITRTATLVCIHAETSVTSHG